MHPPRLSFDTSTWTRKLHNPKFITAQISLKTHNVKQKITPGDPRDLAISVARARRANRAACRPSPCFCPRYFLFTLKLSRLCYREAQRPGARFSKTRKKCDRRHREPTQNPSRILRKLRRPHARATNAHVIAKPYEFTRVDISAGAFESAFPAPLHRPRY